MIPHVRLPRRRRFTEIRRAPIPVGEARDSLQGSTRRGNTNDTKSSRQSLYLSSAPISSCGSTDRSMPTPRGHAGGARSRYTCRPRRRRPPRPRARRHAHAPAHAARPHARASSLHDRHRGVSHPITPNIHLHPLFLPILPISTLIYTLSPMGSLAIPTHFGYPSLTHNIHYRLRRYYPALPSRLAHPRPRAASPQATI